MQQTHEIPPQQELPRPRRPRRFRFTWRFQLSLLAASILIVSIVFTFAYFTQPHFTSPESEEIVAPKKTATVSPQGAQTVSPQNTETMASEDSIVKQILIDENTNGWDTTYHGILINWRRDDPSKVNCSDDMCDVRGHSTRHDVLNDLRDLENLYWYRARHPSDSSLNGYIARILPTVQREWGATTQSKGWLYFTILRMGMYSDDPGYWNNTLQNWAQAQYNATDPVLGVHHGLTNTVAGHGNIPLQDGYRVDGDLELGLALTDAGVRFHRPDWVSVGKREVQSVINSSFNPKYHLFARVYVLSDPRFGSNHVYDPQARMGENGQEIEELLRTGLYTKTDSYVQLAKEMLDALVNSPLHDRVHGGFYYRLLLGDFQGLHEGYIDQSMKETRQFHMLPAVHLANKVFNNRWSDIAAELHKLATANDGLFLPAPVPGFTYRLKPDGALYPCPTCVGPQKNENWVTSEADNIAMEGLQAIVEDKSMP
ncbi:hypothetical protein [Tengunoibacter tsumagoiensis]|uniref:Uncharacterized protein n=1 Tax=Tengunoibacter tsumagoiensis TaxID=2014871 RepID=A0A402A5L6_9CHLR|nr:hypothetical protein [Tengunoibacter tsumagoiensis]GCE14437.1 hypothetical protein KTT_42960 [Tengunoibacter tsumagoiensis]